MPEMLSRLLEEELVFFKAYLDPSLLVEVLRLLIFSLLYLVF